MRVLTRCIRLVPSVFMQAWTSSITAALLLVHLVLGCCWHHGDTACAARPDQHEHGEDFHASSGQINAEGAQRQQIAPSPSFSSEHGQESGRCGSQQCSFIRSESISLSQIDDPSAQANSAGILAAATVAAKATQRSSSVTAAAGAGYLPLRRHLFLGILLV